MIDQKQKSEDLKFGKINEEHIFKLLNKKNNNKIKKYTYKYNIFDFYETDKNNIIIKEYELKSRTIRHNQYDSLVFGLNKFEYSIKQLKNNIEQIYLFFCTDGLYYWKLEDETKQKNEFYFGMISNRKRNDRSHEAVFIYTKYLKKYL
tara:strand:+ start:15 stop:458 length:444 start_codon:yes stop_codon:yes gene_type:complete